VERNDHTGVLATAGEGLDGHGGPPGHDSGTRARGAWKNCPGGRRPGSGTIRERLAGGAVPTPGRGGGGRVEWASFPSMSASPGMIKPRTPPGVMELLPRDQIAFQRMLDTIRRIFE